MRLDYDVGAVVQVQTDKVGALRRRDLFGRTLVSVVCHVIPVPPPVVGGGLNVASILAPRYRRYTNRSKNIRCLCFSCFDSLEVKV